MYFCNFLSPLGKILLVSDGVNLLYLELPVNKNSRYNYQQNIDDSWVNSPKTFTKIIRQLDNYFNGNLKKFDIPFTISCSLFATKVLLEVSKIPFGKTKSYSDIAKSINNPKAARAVGMANAKNQLPIIIPCHRVIGKNKELIGYCGGKDTTAKQFLLTLEQENA